MRYLDTSLLISALTNEVMVRQAQLAIADNQPTCISEWTRTEFSSALSQKLRGEYITSEMRALAMAEFNRLASENYSVVDVSRSHFLAAARFADNSASRLRAGDALHLAIAAELGATVWTLDRQMAAAGRMLGVPTFVVGTEI